MRSTVPEVYHNEIASDKRNLKNFANDSDQFFTKNDNIN